MHRRDRAGRATWVKVISLFDLPIIILAANLHAGHLRFFFGRLSQMKLPTGWQRPSSPSKGAMLFRHLALLARSRFGNGLAMFSDPIKLQQRAKLAAKQMRYFQLFSRKGSFQDLASSAKRAGFELAHEDAARKVAGFRWVSSGTRPDFLFLVSYEDPDSVSVIAESQRDIFGLIMISHAHLPKCSVEVKPLLQKHEVGRNARQFRKILLTFPDFDAGAEKAKSRPNLTSTAQLQVQQRGN
jgi:hypothetical protein